MTYEKGECYMEIERAKTGIVGFDELIEGGFPRGRSILFTGGPGSGKTTTAIQFLVNGAVQFGERGIYVGLELPHSQLVQDMDRYGFDLPRLESENKVLFIAPASPSEVNAPFEELVNNLYLFSKSKPEKIGEKVTAIDTLASLIDDYKIKRVVFDSVPALGMRVGSEAVVRETVQSICNILNGMGCTSIIISEHNEGPGLSRYGVEEFVSNGIIILGYERKGMEYRRTLSIYKLQGTDHSKKIHAFEMGRNGVIVSPFGEYD